MQIRTKSDEQFVREGGVWDQERGDRVARFLEHYLTLDTGKPFTLLPWQRAFIESVYCWVRPDGRRRVKLAFLTLARKNGKTELLAGLTAYHLLADHESSPSCVSCAVDREQAGQIFDKLNWSIQNNEGLRSVLHAIPSRKEIHYPAHNGKYKSVSSDAPGKMGHRTTFCVYDELAFHKNDGLWTALQNSGDSVPNSLQVIISTAGWNKNGCFYRLYTYAQKVLSGEIVDPSFMPWIYETPDGADFDDPVNWTLANPSLFTVLSEDDFRQQWERAKLDTASKLDFIRLKFNSWTEAETTWIAADKWEQCKREFPDLDGAPVHIGIDAGHTTDLTAVVAVFPVDGKFYVRSWGFVPDEAVKKDKQNLIPYKRFALDQSLKIIPGDCVSIEDDLYPLLDEIIARYDVRSITVDKWQLLQLSQHYMKRGLNVCEMGPFHSRFNEPTQAVERAVMNKTLVHDGSSLLRWQVGHAQLDRDNRGYVIPCKKQPHQKIDNLIALVMAFNQTLSTHQPFKSVYDDESTEIFV